MCELCIVGVAEIHGQAGFSGNDVDDFRLEFDDADGSYLLYAKLPGFKDSVKRAFYKVRDGLSDDDLAFETIGYADHAIASYSLFERLKGEGVIPAATRFQASLPTPVAFLSGFIGPGTAIQPSP